MATPQHCHIHSNVRESSLWTEALPCGTWLCTETEGLLQCMSLTVKTLGTVQCDYAEAVGEKDIFTN